MSGVAGSWRRHLAELRGVGARVLEVGSFEGRSAVWFLENLIDDPEARLVCVDPFRDPQTELRFDHNIAVSGAADRVTKLKGFSASVLPTLERCSFDLVYVDGSHRAGDVLLDGVLAWDLLRNGGLLLFDDYRWRPERPAHQRPQLGVDLFLALVKGRHEILLEEYQVLVRKRAAYAGKEEPVVRCGSDR